MAITFENIFKGRVIDSVQKLIKTSLPNVPLYFDENRGQESFLITPVSDNFVDFTSNSHVRQFTLNIVYELRKGGNYTKQTHVARLTDIAEIVKRIFFNNTNYTENNITQWNSGQVVSIDYEREEDEEISRATIVFQCITNEVVS